MIRAERSPRIEVLRSAAELEVLRTEWDELLHDSPARSPFLTWEWLCPWWTHLRDRRRLALVCVRLGGRLIALAPLCVAPPTPRLLLPFRRIEFMGSGLVGSDYMDVILRHGFEQQGLEALERHLARGGMALHLAGLPEPDCAARRLAARLGRDGWTIVPRTHEQCPFVRLDGLTWDAYLERCSAAQRYAFRRKYRHLSARFQLEFEHVTSERQRGPALSVLIDLHNRRWRARGGSRALGCAALHAFHDDASRFLLERGWLRLFVLRLDGRAAAALYGLMYGGVFHFYQAGFDPAFSEWSVGLVMMGLSIRQAIAERAREFDFLHGDEPYKLHWAHDVHRLQRLELYAPRLRGAACRRIAEMSRATRAAARRVLAPAS